MPRRAKGAALIVRDSGGEPRLQLTTRVPKSLRHQVRLYRAECGVAEAFEARNFERILALV